MKDMVKVLKNVIKPRTHTDVFCSALQFSLWYKSSASEKREMQDSTTVDSGELDAEREEKESVKLQLVFKIEKAALHFIRVVRNYHQTTAANHAAHISVLKMVIYFW